MIQSPSRAVEALDACVICGVNVLTLRNANITRTTEGFAPRWMPPEGCICFSSCEVNPACRVDFPEKRLCQECGSSEHLYFGASDARVTKSKPVVVEAEQTLGLDEWWRNANVDE